MGTEESNRSAPPHKALITQEETPNKYFPPHWSTPIQVYHNYGSTAMPFVNSCTTSFSLHPSIWANQKYSTPFQYDSQHDNRSLSSHLVVSEGAALTISEREQCIFSEKEISSRKLCDENLQPRSIITEKSRENGSGSSVLDSTRDRPSCVSSDEGHGSDDTNDNEFLTNKQQCDVVLANGEAAEKEAIKNLNTIHVNGNSALEDIAVNSTEPNANVGTCPSVAVAKAQLSKLEEEEIRRERKRQLNRESARRSRVRKQHELEELQNTVDNLRSEVSIFSKKLMKLSEDCVELSDTNDSIEKELIEQYGQEVVADLVATKPARITADESPKIIKGSESII